MATTYTAKIEINTWKEHTCAYCSTVYAYRFVRGIKGQGGSVERAEQNARKAVGRALACSVNLEPCPSCGLYQPDMVAQQRAGRHRVIFWVALVVLAITTILYLSYAMQADTAMWTATMVCGIAAAAHWCVEMANLNANPQANRLRAQEHINMGTVQHQPGNPARGGPLFPAPRSLAVLLCLWGLCVAVVLTAAPEFLRQSRGWPLNRECYPPVIGPGDQTRIYMPQSISSIKGYWRGEPKVTICDRDTSEPPRAVSATTNQNSWGDTIHAKSSEKASSCTPWVQITLPPNPEMAGKTELCEIGLAVEYPEAEGSSTFRVVRDTMHREVDLRLANAAEAGSAYAAWWWEGTGIGMVLTLICGRMLIGCCKTLCKGAKPTRIVQPAESGFATCAPGAGTV